MGSQGRRYAASLPSAAFTSQRASRTLDGRKHGVFFCFWFCGLQSERNTAAVYRHQVRNQLACDRNTGLVVMASLKDARAKRRQLRVPLRSKLRRLNEGALQK